MSLVTSPPQLTKTQDQLLVHPPSSYTYLTIPSDFECPICTWPLLHPLVHNGCGNSFCHSCCSSLSTCPMCREPVCSDNLVPCNAKLVLNMLDNLEVTCNKCKGVTKRSLFSFHFNEKCDIGCPNECGENVVPKLFSQHWENCKNTVVGCSHQDCSETFQRKNQIKHEAHCYHGLVPCIHCKSKIKRGELEEHYLVCDEVEIPCELCCGEKFKRKVKNHCDTCPEVIMKCLSSDIGCNFVEKRRLTNDHEKSCSLFKLRPYVVSLQTTVQNLQNTLKMTIQDHDTLHKEHDILQKNHDTLQKNHDTLQKNHDILQETLQKTICQLDWTFISSTRGSETIKDNSKRVVLSSDGVAYTTKIPDCFGVVEIKFKVLQGENYWIAIGIASTESLKNEWLKSGHYVGWYFLGHNDTYAKKGILAGYENQKNIFLNKSKGEKSLPKIKDNDTVNLIFDNNRRTLSFKHNGELQDIVVTDIPKIDLYFFVGRWNGVVEVCIL